MTARSAADVSAYVHQIVDRAEKGDHSAAEEALHVALPLVYRLGLDDSSSDDRIAARIQDVACKILMPDLHGAAVSLLEEIMRGAGLSYATCQLALSEFMSETRMLAGRVSEDCHVYGRVKSPIAVFLKFYRYLMGEKKPKGPSPSSREASLYAIDFLDTLACRMGGDVAPSPRLDLDALSFLLPDLVGVTTQFGNSFGNSRLGIARRRYHTVLRIFDNQPSFVRKRGPFFSRHWHMNRMAFHVLFGSSTGEAVPVELLVRTDLDYFLGYANYWRYKNIQLLDPPGSERRTRRLEQIAALRACRHFSEVQELILRELQSGQLLLFWWSIV
jgi:hypothetical protein